MKDLRQQIAATLRHLAQAILDGAPLEGFDWLAVTPDGLDFHTQVSAQEDAEQWCVPDDDEWPDEIENVCWGIFVPIESATQCDREETPEGPHDYTCNYELRATVVQSDRLVTARGDDIAAPLPGATADRRMPRWQTGNRPPSSHALQELATWINASLSDEEIRKLARLTASVQWAEVDPDDAKLAAITKALVARHPAPEPLTQQCDTRLASKVSGGISYLIDLDQGTVSVAAVLRCIRAWVQGCTIISDAPVTDEQMRGMLAHGWHRNNDLECWEIETSPRTMEAFLATPEMKGCLERAGIGKGES